MRVHSTTARGAATALGCAASFGAAYILLKEDVMAGHWSDSFVLVPLMLLIAVVAGHLAAKALRDRSILSASGFALAFLLGTVLTVYTSVSKQAMKIDAKVLETVASNKDRGTVEAALKIAQTRYQQALDQADKARSSGGCGRVCIDWSQRAVEVDSHIAKLKAELQSMDPVKPVAAGPERVAVVIHMLAGLETAKVKALLLLVEPFAFALLFELTAISSFGYGFGGFRQAQIVVRTAKTPTQPELPGGDRRDSRIVSWCDAYAQRHGRRPSIPEVQQAFDVGKTSAWRYSRSRHGLVRRTA